jgi:DHA1 family bicyclomycin/chloramphenicol resistance-like MFS transporter
VQAPDGDSQPPWTRSYRELLASRVFVAYTFMYAFIQGSFFAFLAVGAAVFADHLGLGQRQFGFIWGAMALIYVAGAAAGVRLTERLGPRRALVGSSCVAAAAGCALAVIAPRGLSLVGLLVPLGALMAAAGVQTPLALAGAVNERPDISGTAAGLSSSLALGASGVFSIAAGLAYTGSFAPVAFLMAACTTATLLTCWLSRPPA